MRLKIILMALLIAGMAFFAVIVPRMEGTETVAARIHVFQGFAHSVARRLVKEGRMGAQPVRRQALADRLR